jgi:hypothetical protein
MSILPSPIIQKHLQEIESLKWQIDYEKKLHDEINQILESKVSNLIANGK